MGKKKVLTEIEINKPVLPGAGQVFGVTLQLLGYDRLRVKCADGHTRLCRIRGKMKRRVWIREGDTVIVAPWDFQSDRRGDVIWRYTKGQVQRLQEEGYLNFEST